MAPAAIGIGAGTLGSVAVTSALKSVLVGAGAASPLSFLAAVVLLALVSAAACYFPASRATRIDPAIALRAD
jgi:putative ABC transport system permease protein